MEYIFGLIDESENGNQLGLCRAYIVKIKSPVLKVGWGGKSYNYFHISQNLNSLKGNLLRNVSGTTIAAIAVIRGYARNSEPKPVYSEFRMSPKILNAKILTGVDLKIFA